LHHMVELYRHVRKGYQDPYRARLTPTEAVDLDLAESMESSLPYCTFTNRGLALVFPLCPRLSSLTIRHAPYITRFPRIDQLLPAEAAAQTVAPASTSQPSVSISIPVPQQFPQSTTSTVLTSQPPQISTPSSGPVKVIPNTVYRSSLPLKSLTLENCPGITASELESILAKGDPFGFLESLVLRDMFPLSRETVFMGPAYHWSQRWLLDSNTISGTCVGGEGRELSTSPDYRKLGLLLSIADLLSSRLVGYPPISPVGIGMGSSVRDVSHSATTTGLRVYELPVQPFDIFFTLRTHTYLTSLLQMDGTCGRRIFGPCRIHRLLLDSTLIESSPEVGVDKEKEEKSAFFVSRSTQTCVCGLLEWDFVQRLHVESGPSQLPPADPKDQGLYQHQHQLGGPLAFHPFPVLLQHNALYQKLICSDWADKICATANFDRLRDKQCSFVRPLCGPGECFGCGSGFAEPPSKTQLEPSLHHTPRVWTARDACVDTSELRQFVGPKACVLTLRQPIASPLSCLTTLHFERVGLTHLVLSSVPRLKNITLENCPALTAILFHGVASGAPATAITVPSPSSTVFPPCIPVKMTNPVPFLRRVRIIRCPKFAIYNWLGAVAALYPYHEENIFITFREWFFVHHARIGSTKPLNRDSRGAAIPISTLLLLFHFLFYDLAIVVREDDTCHLYKPSRGRGDECLRREHSQGRSSSEAVVATLATRCHLFLSLKAYDGSSNDSPLESS
uniref:DUF4206 domain-containing protein n=1 Tax=Hydatigena taeniaeformis TaxID=6205 RepID=A0A0R3WP81_HYDTA